ncbi:hypothetical protein CASFOL_011965 [Castilleja foliolosa]|uniref:DUF7950 domain-containing protein n=1 Tax=Castilleja foliolosa TaxID=1961234 RepID=A0ABD3DP15_9LAMI
MRRSSDYQSVMINRMMLRFRPIAPKPVDGGESASGAAEQERGKAGAWRRVKRKYVRVRGRQGKKKVEKKSSPSPPEICGVEDSTSSEKASVTLQLLPERSESAQETLNNTDPCNVDDDGVRHQVTAETDRFAVRTDGRVVETTIILERVTDRFAHDQIGLGFSDEEKIYGLEKDTCPGFISDWTNNVIWVNEAYRNMVAAEEGFLVWLVVKDELPQFYPSFACRVRVIQRRGQGQNWNKIVPCDVWRMECARFAWKLDVNTALSLSL